MPIDPISCVASTLSGLATAFKLVEFGYQVRDVPIDSLVFIDLLANVQADLEHATACLREIEQDLAAQPSFHRTWIVDTIVRTVRALDEIGSYILAVPVDQETSSSLGRRINYVLHDYKKLSDREKRLRASHNSLLSAINAMHMLIYPRFRTRGISSTKISVPDDSAKNHITSPSNQEPNTTLPSVLPSRPKLSFESSRSLPILSESPDLRSDWSPESPTITTPLQSPSSVPETEYAYPELENAFRETRKSIDSRKSTDSLQRPSRQKPTESTYSLSSTLYPTRNSSQSTLSSTTTTTRIMNTLQRARNDSQSTLYSTATETNSWQSSNISLPEEQFSHPHSPGTIHPKFSDLSFSETPYSEPKLPSPTTSRRPSRQRPRPRPHSSFSDNVLASADLKLDGLSRFSSPRSSIETQRSLETDEKIATTVAYDELVDYIQLLRKQSTRGQRHSINIST